MQLPNLVTFSMLGIFGTLTACGGGGGGPVTNSAPVITSSATLQVNENTTQAATIVATDANGDNITFSISGGSDQGQFTLNPSSGVLSFNTATDYENPTDSDLDNIYNLDVTASDSKDTQTQSISITVLDNQHLSVSWAPNRETAVNRAGGGYKILYSTSSGFDISNPGSVTDPSIKTITIPYASGPTAPTTSPPIELPAGPNYLRVFAYSTLTAPWEPAGTTFSLASPEISVVMP